MAYFLKKSNLRKGTYLQIYESFYDPLKKQTAHRSYKAIGYVNELMDKGIEDPVTFYSAEVSRLNQEFHDKKQQEKRRLYVLKEKERIAGNPKRATHNRDVCIRS